jgi:hypothetical protein
MEEFEEDDGLWAFLEDMQSEMEFLQGGSKGGNVS